MRSIILLLALCSSLWAAAQHTAIDSLYQKLATENTDTGKALVLTDLSFYYQMYKPDSALLLSQEAYSLSRKHQFLRGQSWALAGMADAFHTLDNYPKAVEYYIAQLKIEEKRNEPYNIASIYNNMASVYNSERDVDKALYYSSLADSMVKQYQLTDLALFTNLNIGDIYEKADKLDLALLYTQRCYDLSRQQHNELIEGTALNNMGNIYVKMGDYLHALDSYKKSTPYLSSMKDYNTLSECQLGLAGIYEKLGCRDSAYHYARKVFNLAMDNEFLKRAADASGVLVRLYDGENRIDSAFRYEKMMVALRDSIDSNEKIRKLQSITIEEELRQKELAEERLREAEETREKLQLLSIGLAIPVFFFISMYLSRQRVHASVIRFSGIVSLLMVFEYITLLIHPLVSDTAHHSPVVEIILFVALASLITPVHHKIEHWLLTRLSQIHEFHLRKRQKIVPEDLP